MTLNPDTLNHLIQAADGSTATELSDAWGVAPRVAGQWLTSKQSPIKVERYARQRLEDFVEQVQTLDSAIKEAGKATVLLRTFQQDDMVADLLGFDAGWTPQRYNKVVQHIFVHHAITPYNARLVAITDQLWPGRDEEMTVALKPDTPLFAVAHREPDNAWIDLCTIRTSEEQEPPLGLDDLAVLTSVSAETPLPDTSLGGTGLWSTRALSNFVDDCGFEALCDWRISGVGHPIATTTVFPIDFDNHRK